ncbi:MAG: delta-lactam-biosynthetic de-N-acetylase [Firmicutes bacterium HGW-Firmicutes-14]|nr:MAG: delta-lactam-biosynthetic de-N-acetylase [Firmicutes bacterium HGW-Firmicutes-14]
MKNKLVFLALVTFLLTGVAGANMFWMKLNVPQKQSSLLPEQKNSPETGGVFNQKEGWGFVKSKEGETPGITAHQKNLVKKYGALFTGDETKKHVTVTFDMGYEKEGLTPKILDILIKHQVKASFFVTTYWIEKNPDLVKRVVEEGHVLGNHTIRHKSLPTLNDQEVKNEILGWEKVARDIADWDGKHKYMRPPMGEYSERTLKITSDLGYTTAFWSIAIKDWLPMGGPQEAVKGIVSQLHNGAVILLHGNSEDVAGGLDRILTQIGKKGFKTVPIFEI